MMFRAAAPNLRPREETLHTNWGWQRQRTKGTGVLDGNHIWVLTPLDSMLIQKQMALQFRPLILLVAAALILKIYKENFQWWLQFWNKTFENLFINGLLHSSKAETVTSLSVLYSQGPGQGRPLCGYSLNVWSINTYISTQINGRIKFGVGMIKLQNLAFVENLTEATPYPSGCPKLIEYWGPDGMSCLSRVPAVRSALSARNFKTIPQMDWKVGLLFIITMSQKF